MRVPVGRSLRFPRFAAVFFLLASAALPAPRAEQHQPAEPTQLDSPGRQPNVSLPVPLLHGQRVRPQPLRPLGAHAPAAPGPADLACFSPRLSYFGGPVVSNPALVPVFWNADVNATTIAKIPQFLADITRSDYWYLLSEYATDTPAVGDKGETLQSIGGGSATAGVTLRPARCPAGRPEGCTVTDADLQAEIATQINQKVLPAPTVAYDGQMRTIYMVYFPANVTLTGASVGTSCVDFCAYHNSATATLGSKPQTILYTALMDTYTSACSKGCGSSATGLGNLTSTTAHELTETVTDANVGFVTGMNYAWPSAWADNDNYCGEIADICSGGNNYPITVSGRTWEVQPLWSNKLHNCAITGVYPAILIDAPASVLSTGPFLFSVAVVNPSPGHSIDTAFAGTLSFRSSDPAASSIAPVPFALGGPGFARADATLKTPGAQTLTATGANPGVTGSTTVNVGTSLKVAVQTLPAGLSFAVDGRTYTSRQSFTWSVGSQHALSTGRVQLPAPGVEMLFQLWSDGGARDHRVTVRPGMTTYTAVFAPSYLLHALADQPSHGSVAVTGSGWFAAGTRVAITAIPYKGYAFSHWIGPVDHPDSPRAFVIMKGPITVSAQFVPSGKAIWALPSDFSLPAR